MKKNKDSKDNISCWIVLKTEAEKIIENGKVTINNKPFFEYLISENQSIRFVYMESHLES